MKVLDLQCSNGHVFEGWFASEEDFSSQQGRRLVQCPVCADAQIAKRLTAPRLNLRHSGVDQRPEDKTVQQSPLPRAEQAVQAAYFQALRKIVAASEDVGERFAEEARRMHYGEAQMKAIRGRTSSQERAALTEEGIEFHSLPELGGPLQ